MKTIRIFTPLLFGALLGLAACEGGFVEPSGKLLVVNQSPSSTITSVQTMLGSSAWLERWTGNTAPGSEIPLQIDPGAYQVRVKDDQGKESASLSVSVVENGETRVVFDGAALSLP